MKNTNPLVTIVIATYRRKFFLSKTIASVLSQTYSNLEVIVVNDDKEDSLQELIDSFGDFRLHLFEIDHSGRPAVPRNFGARKASGELIAFCDDDDIWFPKKIEEQVKVFDLHPDVKLCYTDYVLMDENDKKIAHVKVESSKKITNFRRHLFKNDITFSTIMVCRRVFLDGLWFDERPILKASEDYLFLSHLLYLYPVFFIESSLVQYRIHLGGISYSYNNARKIFRYYVRIVICFYDLLKNRRISFVEFISFAKFHLVYSIKQILFPYYSKIKTILEEKCLKKEY